uniref:Zinc finger, CCHC-type n=1 Tax=Tanacetum cinerariifolium TaxID=118510 RepID=A0A699IHI8_TANCI|nr:zinc finger, CCHC-type [Tanacetum cinerariifolium]
MVESDKHDKTSSSASVRGQGNILLQCSKLIETNYTTWALMMETILKAYGLWKVIDETDGKNETGGKQETSIDEKAENTAKGIIFQTLPQDMLMQVAQYTTTKEVWNSIKVKHLGADLVQKARLQTLRSELETLKMKLNESANEFAGKLSSIQAKFKSLGGTLKDKVLVRKLLNSVPKKFLPIVASIEQYQEIDTMQFEEAVGRITAFEERLKSQDEPENNYQNKLILASSNNQGGGRGHGRNFTKNKNSYGKGTSRGSIDKSKLMCYECGEHGHFAKECTK